MTQLSSSLQGGQFYWDQPSDKVSGSFWADNVMTSPRAPKQCSCRPRSWRNKQSRLHQTSFVRPRRWRWWRWRASDARAFTSCWHLQAGRSCTSAMMDCYLKQHRYGGCREKGDYCCSVAGWSPFLERKKTWNNCFRIYKQLWIFSWPVVVEVRASLDVTKLWLTWGGLR